MASEDVIELGSSEDELEPAPKRVKPRPNAMVHIPTNLHGITIKPTSSKMKATSSKINIPLKKGPQKQGITITNVPVRNAIGQLAKSKPNGKTLQKPHTKKHNPAIVNPVSLIQKLNSQQLIINKIAPPAKLWKNPMHINSSQTINKLPPGISVTRSVRPAVPVKRSAGPHTLNSVMKKQKLSVKAKPTTEILTVELDDDDTSTSSTASPQWYLTPEQQEETSMKNKNNEEPKESNLVEITIEDSPIKPKLYSSPAKDILSVNIEHSPVKGAAHKTSDVTASEDEDCTSKKLSNSKKKLKYPKEAETMRTVEIEIEPVPQVVVATEPTAKYTQNKLKPFPNDIIVEIEDSPVKGSDVDVITTPKKNNSFSKIKIYDTSEISNMQVKNKSENRAVKISDSSEISNIEDKNKSESVAIAIPDDSEISTAQDKSKLESGEIKIPDTSEISNTHDCKKSEIGERKTPDTCNIRNIQGENKQECSDVKISETSKISDKEIGNKSESSEFHPIYQSFIDLCFKLENSDDMKKIVEKKVKAYYQQCPKEFTESEEFLDLVSGKIISMKAGPEKMYLYMKDIVDELNLQRKMAKNPLQTVNANKESEKQTEKESANFLYGEDSEFDTKRKRQIRKLEKTLKKLHRAIQKLEEQEVDFDDEEDSVYLLTERYKERMVRVHAKFCQLTNTKMPSEPRVQIDPRMGHPSGPAKRLEKWINKKVPIGSPLPFPDFHDVLRCVREANDEDKLGWNEADIMEEARDLFTRCGSKLQRRRQENEWRSAISRISLDIDPAENNDDLKRKLENNRQEANKKVSELLNKYADKQNQLKLEGTEIGDKEAEESPVESEEEEVVEEVTLENKNKRKELIRRLLQEKSRKSVDEKENLSTEGLLASQNDIEMPLVDDIILESTLKETTKEKDLKEAENSEDSKKNVPGEEENKENLNKDNSQVDDDEYRIESDIDELHLLQKLHSENEVNSSALDSSDSDSPIAISDTLESSNEDIKKMSDVISIENSSYSEAEMNEEANDIEFIETTDNPVEKLIKEEGFHRNIEMKNVSNVSQRTVQTTNEEYNEAIEDILLASSSEDEAEVTKETHLENPCVNLKDDNLSIGETVVEGIDENTEKVNDGNLKKKNKLSLNKITSIENVHSPDQINKENITEDTCFIMDDDCVSSESAAKEITEGITSKITHAKCNEYGECISLDDPTDENTADSSGKNNDNEIVDECVSLSDVCLSTEEVSVGILNNKSDNNETPNIMIESNEQPTKECLNVDDKHSSTIVDGDNVEFVDSDGEIIATRNLGIDSHKKVIGTSSDEDSLSVCVSENKNTEVDTNNGKDADMNTSAQIKIRKEANCSSSSPAKNKPCTTADAAVTGLESDGQVVSEHHDQIDGSTDVLKFELVTQVTEDTSVNKVGELLNVSNLTEEKTILKDNNV